jgi:DNA-binding transcriptional LysR family regulator
MSAMPINISNADRFLNAVTVRQIRYFVAVAESGKVSTAAAMISISPSAITGAIGELEALTQVRLFERHAHGMTLTQNGRHFLARCRNVLASIREASCIVESPNDLIEGSFTLVASSTVIGYFIAPLLARFTAAYPKIATRIVEGDEMEVVRGLMTKDYDLAYAITSNIVPCSGLQQRVLLRSPRRLWLSHNHPLNDRDRVTMADVAEQPYIQLVIDGAERSTARYWQANNLKPKTIFRTESIEALRSLVAFGHGVSILADMMYRPWSLGGDSL